MIGIRRRTRATERRLEQDDAAEQEVAGRSGSTPKTAGRVGIRGKTQKQLEESESKVRYKNSWKSRNPR
jgi:hypothetical protein